MDFSFKIEGLDRLAKAPDRVVTEVNKELNKGLFAGAKKIEAEAKKSIANGPKTGRVYKRRSVRHRASAPGEAPANMTGRLINSINAYLNTVKELEAFVVAGRGLAKYARSLEFGTKKMAARPFMFPAAEKSRAWIQERLTKAVRTGLINASRKK